VLPSHEARFGVFEVALEFEASAREEPAANGLCLYDVITEVDTLAPSKRVAARIAVPVTVTASRTGPVSRGRSRKRRSYQYLSL